MRIVGGKHRGRALQAPAGLDTRPTSDRVRESVFNILRHGKWHDGILEGALVMDVFAGTGALGLEALSQGAVHAVFVERDRKAIEACRQNIAAMGEEAVSLVMASDALALPSKPLNLPPRTLIFLDPPYGKNMGGEALAHLLVGGWLAAGAVCVLEMSKKAPEEKIPDAFKVTDERTYGIAQVLFLMKP